MGHVEFAVLRDQGHGFAVDAAQRVIRAGCSEGRAERPGGDPVAHHEPPARGVDNIAIGEEGPAGRIGVNDVAVRLDDEDARAQTVENVGERRGPCLPEINRPAEGERAADMRYDGSRIRRRIWSST